VAVWWPLPCPSRQLNDKVRIRQELQRNKPFGCRRERDRPGRCHRRPADGFRHCAALNQTMSGLMLLAGRRDADQCDRDGRAPHFELNHPCAGSFWAVGDSGNGPATSTPKRTQREKAILTICYSAGPLDGYGSKKRLNPFAGKFVFSASSPVQSRPSICTRRKRLCQRPAWFRSISPLRRETMFVRLPPVRFNVLRQLPSLLRRQLAAARDAFHSEPGHEIADLLRGHPIG